MEEKPARSFLWLKSTIHVNEIGIPIVDMREGATTKLRTNRSILAVALRCCLDKPLYSLETLRGGWPDNQRQAS